ncbi:MAG: hypothetical protein CL516_02615 [Actinobacteria bacterium]|nr:hypothetical protein [Actinomycetota bacterium]
MSSQVKAARLGQGEHGDERGQQGVERDEQVAEADHGKRKGRPAATPACLDTAHQQAQVDE